MSITGSSGTRAISKRYPVTKGLVAETTKQTGVQENLVPEQSSLVSKRDKEGLE